MGRSGVAMTSSRQPGAFSRDLHQSTAAAMQGDGAPRAPSPTPATTSVHSTQHALHKRVDIRSPMMGYPDTVSKPANLASPPIRQGGSNDADADWRKKSYLERAKPKEKEKPTYQRTRKRIRRIFLVRHGQSEGNVNKKMLKSVADHSIPLSEQGRKEVAECGKKLREYFQEEFGSDPTKAPRIRMWVSPYKRTRETSDIILQQVGGYIRDVKEHILLGEQQFGLFEGVTADEVGNLYPVESMHFKKLVDHHGRFWARPPLGESRFDVAKRVHQAFGTFHRDIKRHGIQDLVIVTHGVTLRAIVMMWLHQTPEWFEHEPNPGNGSIRAIIDDVDKGYIFEGFDDIPPSPMPNAALQPAAPPARERNFLGVPTSVMSLHETLDQEESEDSSSSNYSSSDDDDDSDDEAPVNPPHRTISPLSPSRPSGGPPRVVVSLKQSMEGMHLAEALTKAEKR